MNAQANMPWRPWEDFYAQPQNYSQPQNPFYPQSVPNGQNHYQNLAAYRDDLSTQAMLHQCQAAAAPSQWYGDMMHEARQHYQRFVTGSVDVSATHSDGTLRRYTDMPESSGIRQQMALPSGAAIHGPMPSHNGAFPYQLKESMRAPPENGSGHNRALEMNSSLGGNGLDQVRQAGFRVSVPASKVQPTSNTFCFRYAPPLIPPTQPPKSSSSSSSSSSS